MTTLKKDFFVFVVSFSINSVKLHFSGRNREHLFSKEHICPFDKANAIFLPGFKSHFKSYLLATSIINEECGYTLKFSGFCPK